MNSKKNNAIFKVHSDEKNNKTTKLRKCITHSPEYARREKLAVWSVDKLDTVVMKNEN